MQSKLQDQDALTEEDKTGNVLIRKRGMMMMMMIIWINVDFFALFRVEKGIINNNRTF